jgi:hypothetical protein
MEIAHFSKVPLFSTYSRLKLPVIVVSLNTYINFVHSDLVRIIDGKQ